MRVWWGRQRWNILGRGVPGETTVQGVACSRVGGFLQLIRNIAPNVSFTLEMQKPNQFRPLYRSFTSSGKAKEKSSSLLAGVRNVFQLIHCHALSESVKKTPGRIFSLVTQSSLHNIESKLGLHLVTLSPKSSVHEKPDWLPPLSTKEMQISTSSQTIWNWRKEKFFWAQKLTCMVKIIQHELQTFITVRSYKITWIQANILSTLLGDKFYLWRIHVSMLEMHSQPFTNNKPRCLTSKIVFGATDRDPSVNKKHPETQWSFFAGVLFWRTFWFSDRNQSTYFVFCVCGGYSFFCL